VLSWCCFSIGVNNLDDTFFISRFFTYFLFFIKNAFFYVFYSSDLRIQHLCQSVMNAAARLIYSLSRFDHITPLLRQLHWLKAKERIDFKLASVLVFKCVHGSAPPYLADELGRPAGSLAWCRLRSASSSILVVRRTRLTTVGDRSFPVAVSRVWNNLPRHHVTFPSSL